MKLRAIIATIGLLCAGMLVIPVPALAAGTCPPLFSGSYPGTLESTTFPGVTGTLSGNLSIDPITNKLTSDEYTIKTNQGNNLSGTFNGDVVCDTASGTFSSNVGDATFQLTISQDGKNMDGTYDFPNLGDDGNVSIGIEAQPDSAAIGSVQVFEGGAAAGSFSTASLAKGSTRSFNVPVTLTEPAAHVAKVTYRLQDETAVSNVDYVNDNKPHTITFTKGSTERDIPVKIISNTTPQGDRTFKIEIVSVVGTVIFNESSGTVTITDDDITTP